MKHKIFLLFFILICLTIQGEQIYQNYILAYGQGPIGQYIIGFNTKTYTDEEAVKFAKNEIIEFLSGMIYGYKFIYKLENKTNNTKGYFELEKIAKIKETDKNINIEENLRKRDELKIQALYRLSADQKSYLTGFQSSSADMSMGDASESWTSSWDKRIEIYESALRNAVLNKAKELYKSRPFIIKGKILLKESPLFSVIGGEWRVRVKIHVRFDYVNFDNVY